MRSLFFAFVVIFSTKLLAYPENTIRGYPNCLACHVSPRGGGLLTDYGRSLSAEMMSTWKVRPGFEKPFIGLVNNTDHLKWGGGIRAVQSHQSSNTSRRGRFFLMQNNIEAMVTTKDQKYAVVGSISRREGPAQVPDRGDILSDRHFVMFSPSDNTKLRVGKFSEAYGLHDPNHTRFTRQNLGFGPEQEVYQIEHNTYFDAGEWTLAAIAGKLSDNPRTSNDKKGMLASATWYGQGESRLTYNSYYQKTDRENIWLNGISGVLGIKGSKKFYTLFDLNYKRSREFNSNNKRQHALISHLQLGYLSHFGVNIYGLYEHFQSNLAQSETLQSSPGIGLRWLPIPHLELQAEYQYRINQRNPSDAQHRSWFVTHVYY